MPRDLTGLAKFLRKVNGQELPEDRYDFPAYRGSMLNRRAILRVLDGDIDALMSAFHWASSPFSPNYWDERYMGRVDMTDEDYAYCRYLLEVTDERGV